MNRRRRISRPRPRVALGALLLSALGLALLMVVGLPGRGVPGAAGLTGAAELEAQTDDSVPATSVTMFGSSPAEAPGESWGVGRYNSASALVRYTREGGWTFGPALVDHSGTPLSGFQLDQPEAFRLNTPSPLAGQMTPAGAGALAGTVGQGGAAADVLLIRDPGGAFTETAPVPAGEEGLAEGERLFGVNRAPLLAALDEPGGKAGAFVVPVNEASGVDSAVLHWDGTSWTREPIEIPAQSSEQFEVLAIGASSPGNAWLLARLSPEYPAGSVALFRRHVSGGEASWHAVVPKPAGEAGEPLKANGEQFTVPSRDQAQVLTVTSEGVWVDGLRRDLHASTALFFKPEGEADVGRVLADWCKLPSGAPEGAEPCTHELPEPLPTGQSRSFAWAGGGEFGERVITGLRDGVSLRLQGSEFTTVLSLGGDAGGSFGAAFSSEQEGWLGKELLPVHLTLKQASSPSHLAAWPVPFRYALSALAPQPGVPVGALASQVLAVGDRGEVARYRPGQGWFPETLPGPGGRRETPRLRAVAWPTPMRAFAVGDLGQMWLWRGETGLWEKDPEVPLNFRGNLLGIAFDPADSSRGYAVGQGGVLLRYGKSWTQEPAEAIPPPAQGASFTSIAFAGSEAIVAYRKLKRAGQNEYAGGVIVNDGSGWHVDQAAVSALGESQVPWAVAGLPDGGAAFTAQSATQGAQVFERSAAGAPWQGFAYPGGFAPGALTLFREAGALRAIGVGGEPFTFSAEDEQAPPPGSPPILVNPYPLISNAERGVLRQTATGWSDEEHELNDAKEPPGEYVYYDTPYEPDPVSAVLVDPTGTQGWAVGGNLDTAQPLLDTADIYRYPADGSTPPGVGAASETATTGVATFAIGGGAQCAAPCAARADTSIGPDVWLQSALATAHAISGLRGFLYTGPRLTNGLTAGPPTIPVPYDSEEQRYSSLLAAEPQVFPVPAASDLDTSHSESAFASAFSGFPTLGGALQTRASCTSSPGCAGAYYSFESGEGASAVRVIMLDDTGGVEGEQLAFLEQELRNVQGREPAIVVGNANLPAQLAAGDPLAGPLARALESGHASAYFFDAPEQNLRGSVGSVPAFGSGTLGYVNVIGEGSGGGFIGASGFLLAEVGFTMEVKTGRFPVSVKLIPNVGELAMEAQQGTLLRRSQAASFAGLARRPRSGNRAHNRAVEQETSPYIPIPSICLGSQCAKGIFPYYTFESSNPTIGAFVQRNIVSAEANAVLHNTKGEPIVEPSGQGGLFCAFNAGTTTVTLRAGGRSFSLPVTVQAGSVRQPCGTTALHQAQASQQANAPSPPPPATGGAAPASAAPLVPLPAPPAPTPSSPPPSPRHPPSTFFIQPAPSAFVPAFVPVPVPTPARPTPPSGTSAITSPVEAPQREEEDEAAPESVSAEAVAYRQTEHEPSSAYVLGVLVLAAFAGATLRPRLGRRGRGARVAPATITTMRSQRRMSDRSRDLR